MDKTDKILAVKRWNDMLLQLKFPEEIAKDIAKAEKIKRKKRKLTQSE